MSQEQSMTSEQILEFRLGSETYCVSIDYVTEIVDMGELTPIPNSPPHVEGVIDLRGNTTSIIDPKVGLNLDGELGSRIVIFGSELFDDERSVGWAVDSVEEVAEIEPENVDDSPVNREHVRGLIKREDDFIVWVDPKALEESFEGEESSTTPSAASSD